MTILDSMLISVLHPGDLGLKWLLIILAMFIAVIVVPVFLIGFIIYKIATRR